MEECVSVTPSLSTFVDDEGRPICLKFHGYYNNFKRVPAGKCRWKKSCHLSHNTPSTDTNKNLKHQHTIFLQQQAEKKKKTKECECEKNSSNAATLPSWYEQHCRSRLIFPTRSDTSNTFDQLVSALTRLLHLSWSINEDGERTLVSSTSTTTSTTTSSSSSSSSSSSITTTTSLQAEATPALDHLHCWSEIVTPLNNQVPVCPTLIHMRRLQGLRLPKLWSQYYKQPKKMVKLMRATQEYQAYMDCYRTFVRDIILPQFPKQHVSSIL